MAKKLLLLTILLMGGAWLVLVSSNPATLLALKDSVVIFFESKPDIITGELEVTTDKTDYPLGEELTIEVKNISSDRLRTHVGSTTPIALIEFAQRKYTEGVWRREDVICQYPKCTYVTDTPSLLDPGETRSFRWKQRFYVDGSPQSKAVERGVYRFVIRYQKRSSPDIDDWQWRQTLSNAFSIR